MVIWPRETYKAQLPALNMHPQKTRFTIILGLLMTREQCINVKNEGFKERMTASILLFYNSPL